MIFQSPFHRGNGCNIVRRRQSSTVSNSFSPLFIGVTVVTCVSRFNFLLSDCAPFSPLFIGVTVVTTPSRVLTASAACRFAPVFPLQSLSVIPFHRGNAVVTFCPILVCNCWGNGCNRRHRQQVQNPILQLSVPFSSG